MEITKQIILLLTGLVVFVVGMNMMSHGLKNSAGKYIRKLFKKIKDKRIVSAAIGAGTTAIVQSSGATTVMTVGFLSANALTFAQGFAIMLGAFLGTTVTGLFVSLSSFSFSIFLMAIAFIGFIIGFFKNATIKNISEILIGFGILFFGLEAMKGAFNYPDIQNALIDVVSKVDFPFLLMLIGVVITALTQSSSATNSIVIIMVAANPSLLSSGFYLVIGATIGALLPAIIASFNSNTLGKRVTYSTLVCRILMAVLATGIIWAVNTPLFNFLNTIPESNVGILLAVFTIIYNFIYLIIFLPLITPIEKVSNKLIKDKDDELKKKSLHYINDNLLNTPSVAIIQVQKEIEYMFELSRINFNLGVNDILSLDVSNGKEIEDREELIDCINSAVSEYLIKLSNKASEEDETRIGSYYHAINDIERIGDHAYNFLEMARKLINEDLSFSSTAKEEFKEFIQMLDEMFVVARNTFIEYNELELQRLKELEEETDSYKDKLADAHFNRIKKNECKNELSPFHSNLLAELERVADHLTNIGYSSINPTGDEINHNKS